MLGHKEEDITEKNLHPYFKLSQEKRQVRKGNTSPEESKLKNKIKIVREEDKATWV